MLRLVLALVMCGLPLAAQIGFPFPPRNPSGSPQPRPGRTRRTEKREVEQKEADKTVRATGRITEIQDKSWTIAAEDTRFLSFKIDAKTHFSRDGKPIQATALNVGDAVRLEAMPDAEEFLTATNVEAIPADAIKPEARPSQAVVTEGTDSEAVTEMQVKESAVKPAPRDPDDPGRPRLARGIPPPRAHRPEPEAAPAPPPATVTAAAVTPIAPGTVDSLLARARAVAAAFIDTLPNFEVQQLTTRYQSAESGRNWAAQDTVSSDVTYHGGKEEYKNIKINNRLVNKAMMDIPGARSTGEFGTTLVSLFSPASHADFKKLRDTNISNRTAVSYAYVVPRVHSDYRILWGSQYIVPGYSGRVWIDKDTARVLRIEIQADAIPVEFPLDKVEAVIDYGPERLGSESFILPLAAENLSCLRGTSFCGRNVIAWRNYRLYKGEATITFEAK